MDHTEQQRIDAAAEQFTDTLVHSYRVAAERGVSAQEQNVQLTKEFFNTTTSNLRTQAEDNRQMSEQLADQQQRRAEAVRTLTRESVDAYRGFVNSTFAFWRGGMQTEERGAEEAEKATKAQKS